MKMKHLASRQRLGQARQRQAQAPAMPGAKLLLATRRWASKLSVPNPCTSGARFLALLVRRQGLGDYKGRNNRLAQLGECGLVAWGNSATTAFGSGGLLFRKDPLPVQAASREMLSLTPPHLRGELPTKRAPLRGILGDFTLGTPYPGGRFSMSHALTRQPLCCADHVILGEDTSYCLLLKISFPVF